MSFSVNELNTVANTLVSLYENGGLRSTLTDTCFFLEKELGFPKHSLDLAVDKFICPKVSNVGIFTKVEYDNKVYYYDDVMSICTKFTREFMKSPPAVNCALVIVNMKDNSIEKNRFVDLPFIFDAYFSSDK